MNVTCPRCRQNTDLDDTRAGRPYKCTKCGQVFTIPSTRPSAPPRGRAGSWLGSLFGALLLFWLLGSAAAAGYAMFRFHVTPAQVWERFQSRVFSLHPLPPEPPASPLPVARATPTPSNGTDPGPSPASPEPAEQATASPLIHPTHLEPPRPTPQGVTPPALTAAQADAVLGASFTPQATTFRLFAPTARTVSVVLYDEPTGSRGRAEHPLAPLADGLWELALPGNWQGKFYVYRLEGPDLASTREFLDPYATNAVASSTRGRVTAFPAPAKPGPAITSPVDMVVYEMHVRDFTFSPTSGARNRGLYLGFTEPGTHLPESSEIRTALDHLTELGVTHVELLPVQDFANDEAAPRFNWGYVTSAFFSPEGMYATNPNNDSRVREFRALVDALHARGLGVIMDVVYNHTANDASLGAAAPGYYYRHGSDGGLSNGSGCGNETRSEAPLARKLILDSLKFWTREYGIDGYRFDLMALLDQDTMRQAAQELRAINPHVVLYGEPWMGGRSPLTNPTDKTALFQVPVGAFNDDFRNALKGSPDGRDPGFIQDGSNRDALKAALGVNPWFASPTQSVNYMTCHDNLVLWDKLKSSMPDADDGTLVETMKLGYLALFTAQGVPFFQGGEEFGRTKGGNNNSYDASDAVNAVDWSLKRKHLDLFKYTRDAIALRRAHPVFRLRTRPEIDARLRFLDTPDEKTLAYTLDGSGVPGEPWRRVCVVLNPTNQPLSLTLPGGSWSVALNETGAVSNRSATGQVKIRGKSGWVLYQR